MNRRGSRLLVVGASSGVGREVAIRSARAGSSVVFAGRREGLLESGASEGGEACAAIACDVQDSKSCDDLVASAELFLGGIDHVVITAGAVRSASVAETDADLWHDMVQTNLVGPALVARAVLSALERSGGTIVLTSSVTAVGAWPGMAAYAASKVALETFARVLQAEHPNLHVCCIVLGATATDIFGGQDPDVVRAWFSDWKRRGLVTRDRMLPGEVADVIIDALHSSVRLPRIEVVPKVVRTS